MNRNDDFRKVLILGVSITAATKAEVLAWIEECVGMKHKIMVVTPNPEQIMLAQKDGSFREILNQASLALCDGEGLRWAARFLEVQPPIPERVTGEDVMNALLERAQTKGWRVMLMGGRGDTAFRAAEIIQNLKLKMKNYSSKFKIKGIEGMKDIQHSNPGENRRVIREINTFRPDLLFVAFGAPWQEKWLAQNFEKLDIQVGMVVGGALDMIVNPSLRPPDFMTSFGLDWMYRLLRQPWRLWRQIALLRFILLAVKTRLLRCIPSV
ncbi:MAG: hypothetical protein A2785_03155 [Candidatus Chisholmbacteria bacterium RIFCSPHIGHO2_01_FULL_49_18]|uniref:Uncharacterized protein n=1 Tax=Candidatus Chisholmbacteria bacterium RIFCSPHIGHO2_01_FULL_49_18 TaxID=1797590 RepID=A0A1G1VMJ8_9BACT|nr:MAG: hypothetical protein A2785_03155 [Candidatus Chisholmbacteria bacterium RIFCSPHIGHO2_01_FULL_49_18]